jgi:hypothetical protein
MNEFREDAQRSQSVFKPPIGREREAFKEAYTCQVKKKPKWNVPLILWDSDDLFFSDPFEAKDMYADMETIARVLQIDLQKAIIEYNIK